MRLGCGHARARQAPSPPRGARPTPVPAGPTRQAPSPPLRAKPPTPELSLPLPESDTLAIPRKETQLPGQGIHRGPVEGPRNRVSTRPRAPVPLIPTTPGPDPLQWSSLPARASSTLTKESVRLVVGRRPRGCGSPGVGGPGAEAAEAGSQRRRVRPGAHPPPPKTWLGPGCSGPFPRRAPPRPEAASGVHTPPVETGTGGKKCQEENLY